jgi:mono/diheme cytochrome c family protein
MVESGQKSFGTICVACHGGGGSGTAAAGDVTGSADQLPGEAAVRMKARAVTTVRCK